MIPYIDSHNHMQSLSWNDWELMAMAGLESAILSSGNPFIYREILDEMPGFREISRHWNQSLKLTEIAEGKFFLRLFVAAGISAMTLVKEIDKLLDYLETFLRKSSVVALGEVGLDPVQYFGQVWPIEEQKNILREQFIISKKVGKPVILHTPTPKKKSDYMIELGATELPPLDDYRRVFLEMDLDIIAEVGVDQNKIVVDHVDRSVIDFVLKETNAKVGISIGSGLRLLEPRDAAQMVAEYGSERIMLNSDVVAYRPCDILAIPKTIREMLRIGMRKNEIRRVVYENAREFFSLPLDS
jgi:predicted metal-dependent TIM-barrel fold hydrolase